MKVKKSKDYYEFDINFNKGLILPALLVILTLAVNVFFFSANTGVWWDEAEYLSFTNHIVKGAPYSMWEGRTIFYPLLLSVFGFINPAEWFLRVELVIFSCTAVLFTYLAFKKWLGVKVAFFAALLLLSNWLFDFVSVRFLTEVPSLMFQMISLYFFAKDDRKSRLLSGLFLGFAMATRFTSLLLIPAYLLYDLLSKKRLVSYAWLATILLGFIPIMAYDVVSGGTPIDTIYTFIVQSMTPRSWGYNLGDWTYYISNMPTMIGTTAALLFAAGLVFCFASLGSKDKNKLVFVLAYIGIYLFAYSFLTQLKEERYITPLLPFIFAVMLIGLFSISNSIGRFFKNKLKVKYASHAIVAIVILSMVLPSLSMAKTSIENLGSSYVELRIAGEWLNAHASPDQVIMTNAGPQVAYYSERTVTGFPGNLSELFNTLESNTSINYLLVSVYETLPPYITNLTTANFTAIQNLQRNNATMVLLLGYLRQ